MRTARLALASLLLAACSPPSIAPPRFVEAREPIVLPAAAILPAAPLAAAESAPEIILAPTPARAFPMPVVPRERTRVTVLLYHLFGAMETPFAVDPAAFEEQ